MRALEDALDTWADAAGNLRGGAIFVEANPASASKLRGFLANRPSRGVETLVLPGQFGDQVGEITRRIGDDPAFIFVDPTGWKGADMRHIATIANNRFRDVIVNVMFHHLNRWRNDPRKFIRDQMREFFGLGDADLPADLDEDRLMALYREQLAKHAHLKHVADLAVPHPTVERTFFRLVVGGNHPDVLRLFRDAEAKVVGREASAVRDGARARAKENRTGQMTLGIETAPAVDARYKKQHDADLVSATNDLVSLLEKANRKSFRDVWPHLLAKYHITYKDLSDVVLEQARTGALAIQGMAKRERSLKDGHILEVTRIG